MTLSIPCDESPLHIAGAFCFRPGSSQRHLFEVEAIAALPFLAIAFILNTFWILRRESGPFSLFPWIFRRGNMVLSASTIILLSLRLVDITEYNPEFWFIEEGLLDSTTAVSGLATSYVVLETLRRTMSLSKIPASEATLRRLDIIFAVFGIAFVGIAFYGFFARLFLDDMMGIIVYSTVLPVYFCMHLIVLIWSVRKFQKHVWSVIRRQSSHVASSFDSDISSSSQEANQPIIDPQFEPIEALITDFYWTSIALSIVLVGISAVNVSRVVQYTKAMKIQRSYRANIIIPYQMFDWYTLLKTMVILLMSYFARPKAVPLPAESEAEAIQQGASIVAKLSADAAEEDDEDATNIQGRYSAHSFGRRDGLPSVRAGDLSLSFSLPDHQSLLSSYHGQIRLPESPR